MKLINPPTGAWSTSRAVGRTRAWRPLIERSVSLWPEKRRKPENLSINKLIFLSSACCCRVTRFHVLFLTNSNGPKSASIRKTFCCVFGGAYAMKTSKKNRHKENHRRHYERKTLRFFVALNMEELWIMSWTCMITIFTTQIGDRLLMRALESKAGGTEGLREGWNAIKAKGASRMWFNAIEVA